MVKEAINTGSTYNTGTAIPAGVRRSSKKITTAIGRMALLMPRMTRKTHFGSTSSRTPMVKARRVRPTFLHLLIGAMFYHALL